MPVLKTWVFDPYCSLTIKLIIWPCNIYKHCSWYLLGELYSGVLAGFYLHRNLYVLPGSKQKLLPFLSAVAKVRLGEQSSSVMYWSAEGHLSSALFLALFVFVFVFFFLLFSYDYWDSVTLQQIKYSCRFLLATGSEQSTHGSAKDYLLMWGIIVP